MSKIVTEGSFVEGGTGGAGRMRQPAKPVHPSSSSSSSSSLVSSNEIVSVIQAETRTAGGIVAQWLNQMKCKAAVAAKSKEESEKESAAEMQAIASEFEEYSQRPPRLGLGARFLPHKTAVQTMDPVQKRLERHMKSKDGRPGGHQNRALGVHIEDEEDEEPPPSRASTPASASKRASASSATNPLDVFVGKRRLPQKKTKKQRAE